MHETQTADKKIYPDWKYMSILTKNIPNIKYTLIKKNWSISLKIKYMFSKKLIWCTRKIYLKRFLNKINSCLVKRKVTTLKLKFKYSLTILILVVTKINPQNKIQIINSLDLILSEILPI